MDSVINIRIWYFFFHYYRHYYVFCKDFFTIIINDKNVFKGILVLLREAKLTNVCVLIHHILFYTGNCERRKIERKSIVL